MLLNEIHDNEPLLVVLCRQLLAKDVRISMKIERTDKIKCFGMHAASAPAWIGVKASELQSIAYLNGSVFFNTVNPQTLQVIYAELKPEDVDNCLTLKKVASHWELTNATD